MNDTTTAEANASSPSLAKFEGEGYSKMMGTEGNLDYIVVARKPENGLQLGLKVLWGVVNRDGQDRLMVGIRLRESHIPQVTTFGEAAGSASPATNPKAPGLGWDFPWERQNPDRASLVRLMVLERQPEEVQHLLKDLANVRYTSKVLQFLQGHTTEEEWVINVDDLSEYINASLAEGVNKAAAAFDPQAKLDYVNAQKEKFDAWYAEQVASAQKALAEKSGDTPVEVTPLGALTDFAPKAEISASTKMMKSLSSAKFAVIEGGLSKPDAPVNTEDTPTAELHGDDDDKYE